MYGELLREVELIWSNCIEYNQEGHYISQKAQQMREKARALLLHSVEAWEKRGSFTGNAARQCKALLSFLTKHPYGQPFNISLRDSDIWEDYHTKSAIDSIRSSHQSIAPSDHHPVMTTPHTSHSLPHSPTSGHHPAWLPAEQRPNPH